MIRYIGNQLLDEVTGDARQSPRRRKNYNFHISNESPAHRLLNAIEPDSYIAPHRHLDVSKDETVLVLRGALGLVIFDDDGRVIDKRLLEASGDCIGADLAHGTWHTLICLLPGTVMFEAKAGPFALLDAAERAAWAPAEGDSDAHIYMAKLAALFS